jgi:hypothetical protein
LLKLVSPFINFANASLASFARCFQRSPADSAPTLWQETLQNQARFLNESSQAMRDVLAQQRLQMNGRLEKLQRRGEQVATQLAHSTVRAVAIATHARHEKSDRRIFPLPLASDRRGEIQADRRAPLASPVQQATISASEASRLA